jgi:pre-mRNA-processing factor 40
VNSVWTEPAEYSEYKAKLAALATGGSAVAPVAPAAPAFAPEAAAPAHAALALALARGGSVEPAAPVKTAEAAPAAEPKAKARKRVEAEARVYDSDAERMTAFLELLRDMDIGSQHKWADLTRLCGEDVRWAALATTGQRKQAFSEYQTKRLKEEKEERRLKQRKSRDAFLKLLATDTHIDVKTRWREAQQRLASDETYLSLDVDVIDEREREDMFNEFVTELARKDDEEKKEQRKARTEGFAALLKESAEMITHATRWLDLRPLLEAKREPRFDAIDENERRHLFQDFVVVLKREHEVVMRDKERERKAEEKTRQAAFRARVMDKVAEGAINATSTWRDSKLELEKEATYVALEDQPSATARTIFDEIVDVLQRSFRADRKALRDLLDTAAAFKMTHTTSFDGFLGALAEEDEKLPAEQRLSRVVEMKRSHPTHIRLFFDELIAKEVAAHEESVQRQRRLEDRYMSLLEDYYYRSDHIDTPWKEAEYDMRKRSAFLDMKEADRRTLFDRHMATLAKKMGRVSHVSQFCSRSIACRLFFSFE